MKRNTENQRYKVKIRATIEEMNDFTEKVPDWGFYIESFSVLDTFKGNIREEILFNCVIVTAAILNSKELSHIFGLGELSRIVGGKTV